MPVVSLLDPFQDNYVAKVIGDSSQQLLSDSDGNKYATSNWILS